MKALHAPRVKLEAKSPKNTMLAQAMGAKVATSTIGAKVSRGFTMTRKSCRARSHWQKKVKQDLMKIKCFNHEHLVKDYPNHLK